MTVRQRGGGQARADASLCRKSVVAAMRTVNIEFTKLYGARGRRLLARGWNAATAVSSQIRWSRVGLAAERGHHRDLHRHPVAPPARPRHPHGSSRRSPPSRPTRSSRAACAIAAAYGVADLLRLVRVAHDRRLSRALPHRRAGELHQLLDRPQHRRHRVLGGAIRYRIYSFCGLRLVDIAKLCFVTGLTFWLGNLTVLGLGMVYVPAAASAVDHLPRVGEPGDRHRGARACSPATSPMCGASRARSARIGGGSRCRTGRLTVLQILIGIADLFFCAVAMSLLIPSRAGRSISSRWR